MCEHAALDCKEKVVLGERVAALVLDRRSSREHEFYDRLAATRHSTRMGLLHVWVRLNLQHWL